MFDYIQGILTKALLHTVTIDVHGIGYRLLIPLNHFAQLPPLGQKVTLFISSVIREDAHSYYGFLTEEQRTLFETLIHVSGIGPKTALALLGHMEIGALEQAISQGKAELICKIPGIGKKTSERLIIEMRDKIKSMRSKEAMGSSSPGGLEADAISTLLNLGYNLTQAQKAIASVTTSLKEPTLPGLITAALRCI